MKLFLFFTFFFANLVLAQSFKPKDSLRIWAIDDDVLTSKIAYYENNSDSSWLSKLYLELGIYYFNEFDDYDKSLYFYHQSIDVNPLITQSDLNTQGKSYLNMNLVLKRQGQIQLAHQSLKKALSYFILGNDNCGKSYAYNKLGITYYNTFRFDKAIENYQLGLSFCDTDTCPVIIDLHANIGSAHIANENFNTGLEFLNKALILSKLKQDTIRIYSNYTMLIYAASTYPLGIDASKYFDTLKNYQKTKPNTYFLNRSKIYLASHHFQNHQNKKALDILNEVEVYFIENQDFESLRECYLLKSAVLFNESQIKEGLLYQQNFLKLDYNQQLNQNFDSSFLDQSFNYDKRILKLNQLENKMQEDQEQLKKQKWIYILFLIFTILMIYQVFRYQKKIDQFKEGDEAPFVFNQKDLEEGD